MTVSAPKILAFSGSLRQKSYNALALERAVRGAEAGGGSVTRIQLADFPLPVFDESIADVLPPKAVELRQLVAAHDGLLIASPEHSSSVPVVVKNLIDWISRPHAGEPVNAVFRGKAAALLGASTDDMAALRGLTALSSILSNIGVFVLPYPVGVSRAAQAFGPSGELLDAKLGARVESIGKALAVTLAQRGKNP